MRIKILAGSLLTLSAANTFAGNITYKADDGSMVTILMLELK